MITRVVGKTTLTLLEGDIAQVQAEAVVTAANSDLAGGGGVDGAIHAAAGPALLAECRKIGGCPTGRAVATSAGRLPAKYVYHAVGPIYDEEPDAENLLRSAYQSCLDLAQQHQVESIVFPSLSTGVYGYPLYLAAPIALRTVITHLQKPTCLMRVTFVLRGRGAYPTFEQTLSMLLPD